MSESIQEIPLDIAETIDNIAEHIYMNWIQRLTHR